MHPTRLIMSLLVMLALALGVAPAQAETVNCTAITALPAIITVQGLYCFIGHLATAITSGNAIDIQTNNVVLDLNGFKLGGLAAGTGTLANRIHADNRQNITLKNGTVRGFFKGIILTDAGLSQGHVVEDIRADQNTFAGIEVEVALHLTVVMGTSAQSGVAMHAMAARAAWVASNAAAARDTTTALAHSSNDP